MALTPIASSALTMHASFGFLADAFFWDNKIFSNDTWSAIMNSLRIGLTFSLAFLILYVARAHKLGEPVPERWQKRVAILFTVLAFGAYFDMFNPNVRYREYYHRHEFFHYYLGSKYFEEIGYQRLYECAAVAEVELGRGDQVAKRQLRDLRVNLVKQVPDTYVLSHPEECKSHFKPARWEAWKKDVDWFYHSSAGSYWENMQQDHGYNPPPVWTMAGKFFAQFAPAGDKFFKVLASMDVLFHIGIVLLIGWAFGWRVMTVATVFWGCNAPANFYWTGGAFMRQDWVFFLVAAVCLARKRHFALAGAALTWSSLLRVFPMILFVGWILVIGFHLLRQIRRRMAARDAPARPTLKQPDAKKGLLELLHPSHRALIAGCIIAGGILIPASLVVAGPYSYDAFKAHILVHKNTPLTNHMGLETVVVHDWAGRMRFTRDDNLDDPFEGWKQGRLDRIEQHRWLFRAIIVFFGLWTAWALRRTKLLWAAVPLGLPLTFCLTNLTCYYYSMYIVAAVLIEQKKELAPVILAVSGASQVLLINYYWVDDKYTAQSWLFLAFSILILYAYSRPFSIERLKAWWEDRPENKLRSKPPPEPLPAK